MTFERRSLYGMLPQGPIPSMQTVRLVPIGGVHPDQAWPLRAPGSAESMTNFLPVDGGITPRSRLSSLNTLRTLAPICSMARIDSAVAPGTVYTWLSGYTQHAMFFSTGSISRASFVSSYGLGVQSIGSSNKWSYAPVFSGRLNENMLVAAGDIYSYDTLVCLYFQSGVARYSYLTQAPQAAAIGTFDSYLVAFNTKEDGSPLPSRVRWNVRGDPEDWSSPGSGFEDLLDMKGSGTAVVGLQDNRMILFGDQEIWYAVTAAYPAQFDFRPLERAVGCLHPQTIQQTEYGVVFLGSDNRLRILPYGGGVSQVIAPQIATYMRRLPDAYASNNERTNGVYDPLTKCYYLHVESNVALSGMAKGVVVNLESGQVGYLDYNDVNDTPKCGVSGLFLGSTYDEAMLWATFSTGTVCSSNSKLDKDFGSSVVTAAYQSTVLGVDLPGDRKLVTELKVDYTATSRSTLTAQFSADGGYTFSDVGVLSLASAPRAGRAALDLTRDATFPSVALVSTSTGFTIQRVDVTITDEGRSSA